MDNKNDLVVVKNNIIENNTPPIQPLDDNGNKDNKDNKLKRWIIILSCALFALIVMALVLINEQFKYVLDTDEFYRGIYIDDIDVGGKTKDEAFEFLYEKHSEEQLEKQVDIEYEDNEYGFTEQDLNVSYNDSEVIEQAFNEARHGWNFKRYIRLKEIEKEGVRFYTQKNVDLSPIQQQVYDVADFYQKELEEQRVVFNPSLEVDKSEWFEYIDAIYGVDVDEDLLWERVIRAFSENGNHVVEVPHNIIVPTEVVDLKSVTKLITSFKSKQVRNSNRQHNVDLACAAINGTVLLSGEVFSMNETTGERTLAKGYREANVIVGGNELIPGIAGGVCQVSGTLYNAAFRANLEIVERHHHSFELSYLKRGTDATVDYGSLDFRFKNNFEYPIYIAMYADGLDVYAEIFGAKSEEYDYIDMAVKTKKTIPIGEPIYVKDSSVPFGSEPVHVAGRKGITCDVYKVYYDADGKEIEREKSYRDVYKHYSPELRVNPLEYEFYTNPEKFNFDMADE